MKFPHGSYGRITAIVPVIKFHNLAGLNQL